MFASISCLALPLLLAGQHPTVSTRTELLPLSSSVVQEVPLTRREAARIKALIKSLAKIDSADFGLSPTMSGTAFAPIEGQESVGAMLLTNQPLKRNSDLTELVKLGPKALPLLLEALSDHTPTKLRIAEEGMMWMEFSTEVFGNPANKREQAAIDAMPKPKIVTAPRGEPLPYVDEQKSHTVTVGDVCFTIIGQIVARPYEGVGYRPSMGMAINSPTKNPEIARAVRAIWSSPTPRRHLYESLLLDYESSRDKESKAGPGLYMAENCTVPAAMRLLYYFPKESSALIAARLDQLDVEWRGPAKFQKNGLDADELVARVAWCRLKNVHEALLRVAKRTEDRVILADALRGTRSSDASWVIPRVQEFLDKAPLSGRETYAEGRELLMWAARQGEAVALAVFYRYVKGGNIERIRTACIALEQTHPAWSPRFLAPFLSDRRSSFRVTYEVIPGKNDLSLEIRICDFAAAAIAAVRKDLHFHLEGTHEDLDRRIETIRAALRRR